METKYTNTSKPGAKSIPVPNTFILHVCDNKEEYESKTSSLSMELDSFKKCIKQFQTALKQNDNCFYGAFITTVTGEIVWEKTCKNKGKDDADNVVRCHACKHRAEGYRQADNLVFLKCKKHNIEVLLQGSCADGERRSNA